MIDNPMKEVLPTQRNSYLPTLAFNSNMKKAYLYKIYLYLLYLRVKETMILQS